ncbi:MAG: phage protein Gp37 [Saccharofermentanales bacterium]|jgi:phage gp37-like protein
MNYSFEDYETAILAALAGLKVPSGYLKTLQGYAGDLDEEAALENFTRGFPGVLVEVGEATYEVVTMPYYSQMVTVNLLVGARSYRDQSEARWGSTGVFRILNDVRTLILGKNFGLEIRPLTIISEEKICSAPQIVIYLAQYKIINDRIEDVL